MSANKIKIVAISSGKYPESSALSIRHLSILRGIIENGSEARLLSLYAWGERIQRNDTFNNIPIEHLLSSRTEGKGLLWKAFFNLIGVSRVILKLVTLRLKREVNAVLIFLTKSRHILPILLICKILGLVTFHERTELPFLNVPNTVITRIRKFIYFKITIPYFHSLIVISNNLFKYFESYYSGPIFLFPILVEPDRFNLNLKGSIGYPYIAYCGNLSIYKDGLDILLKSIAKLKNSFSDIRLVVIGDIDGTADKNEILNLVRDLELGELIKFTGKIPYQEVPTYLNNAKALVLSRPDNIQAMYGLPTKMGEYLMTGNPVVITSVGDIPIYLKDGESAFISQPGSVISFSERLFELFSNPEQATKIGQNGKEIALSKFNYLMQSERLLNHINKILSQSLKK